MLRNRCRYIYLLTQTPRPSFYLSGNDVPMIQSANVGVGISGYEGQQAVNSSDFSVSQFRFLRELLLVHGRWNYVRMCKVFTLSFYKNIVLVLVLFLFQTKCFWSAQVLFDEWLLAGFNFFLGLPILWLGIFDRDIPKIYR